MPRVTLKHRVYNALYGSPPAPSEPSEGWGLILMADGVGGLDSCGMALRHVVGAQRLPYEVRILPWGHGLGRWHADLTRTANRDAWAHRLAEEVRAFRAERPGAPVHLVGKSGGTGLVVKALEQLPERSVDSAILLAPALSPSYDLTRALQGIARELIVFWSPLDLVVLGAGTWVFGTIDRVHGVSAGLVGFRGPNRSDPASSAAYARLRQVRWGPRMAATGYLGGHIGPDLPAFLRKYVVPLLRGHDSPSS